MEATTEKRHASVWAWLGYIAAVLVPIVGLVFAIPCAVRREYNHVLGIILTVVVSYLLRMMILAGSFG